MVMDRCTNSYRECKSACTNNVAKYVCQDKMRLCLGDLAKRSGGNNLWPHQNANYNDVSYINVNDYDGSFVLPPQNNPFAIPKNQITGGCIGVQNRTRPYQMLHSKQYGGLLKTTAPCSRDPIYY